MVSMNEIDIIIVNYNSTDHLLRCFRSIFDEARGVALRVWVQDNYSRDNVDRVRRAFPQVRLTKNDSNLGFARAVNQALKESFSPYVLILNPDTLVNLMTLLGRFHMIATSGPGRSDHGRSLCSIA
jgi:GT2 family glycosyltransferase